MKWTIGLLVVALSAGAAVAEAPERSARPVARPNAVAAEAPQTMASAVPQLRPAPRPQATGPGPRVAAPGAIMPPEATDAPTLLALQIPRPPHRPAGLGPRVTAPSLSPEFTPTPTPAAVVRNRPGAEVVLSAKGSVCGDPAIKGEVLSPIGAKVNGCGIANPVRVTQVAGIRLSQAITVDCSAAKALKKWIDRGLNPVYGKNKVVQLQIAGSYMCRTRNHKAGAKISEHGRGKAVDIAGLTFANGKSVSVLKNYDASMRKAHKAACGIFGTTLGPGSDGMHEDHLHFDTASYRKGAYCR